MTLRGRGRRDMGGVDEKGWSVDMEEEMEEML